MFLFNAVLLKTIVCISYPTIILVKNDRKIIIGSLHLVFRCLTHFMCVELIIDSHGSSDKYGSAFM